MVKTGQKEKVLCGGKLIVTNFKKLNPRFFAPLQNFTRKELIKQFALCMPDGKIYVNAAERVCDLVSGVLEVLMQESRAALEEYEREYGKKYPHIKNFDDWAAWMEKAQKEGQENDIMYAFAVLMVPIELNRRKIEKAYY